MKKSCAPSTPEQERIRSLEVTVRILIIAYLVTVISFVLSIHSIWASIGRIWECIDLQSQSIETINGCLEKFLELFKTTV